MIEMFRLKCIKVFIIFNLLMYTITVSAGNFFTGVPNDKGFRILVETGLGYNHYMSSGGLYKMNQTVYHATGIIGYEFNSLLIGLGGEVGRYTKEHLYSFKAFLDVRYILKNTPLEPYGELLGGVVGYLKWNDFVKPYYGFGAGIHMFPRVCTGIRVSNVGTLDNTSSWEYSLCVSFIIGK